MGRATGSIVTLALLVLLVLASTSPAGAAVRGGAGNGADTRDHQQGGDQGGPEHRVDPKSRSGSDAQARQRDGGVRDVPQPDVEQRDDKQRDRDRAQSQRVDKQRDDKDRDQPQRDDKQRDDRERDEPQRDDKDRDQPQRDDKDRDQPQRDEKDRDEPEREDRQRDDKGREEEAPEDEDRPAPRPELEREAPRPRDDEANDRDGSGPRGDGTPPAEARRSPRRPLEGESSTDASPSTTRDETDDSPPLTSTSPDGDAGAPVIGDGTPTLDPESLQTMGLGGYVAGDFGWFDGRSGGGQFFGVPDVPAMIGGLPVLLAVLGAFLALQRGIGQGLGHVPMDPTSTEQGPHGQH